MDPRDLGVACCSLSCILWCRVGKMASIEHTELQAHSLQYSQNHRVPLAPHSQPFRHSLSAPPQPELLGFSTLKLRKADSLSLKQQLNASFEGSCWGEERGSWLQKGGRGEWWLLGNQSTKHQKVPWPMDGNVYCPSKKNGVVAFGITTKKNPIRNAFDGQRDPKMEEEKLQKNQKNKNKNLAVLE